MTARTSLISSVGKSRTEFCVSDVFMFRSDNKYTDAYLFDGSVRMLHDERENCTIKTLQVEFASEFVLIKRGCLVRRTEILDMTRDFSTCLSTVLLSTGMYVPVSRREVPKIRQLIKARDLEEFKEREELDALLNVAENMDV